MEKQRRSFWQILRKMLGSRSDLPFADTEAALSQLPEATWQQVAYDEHSEESAETRDPR